ncbi:aldose epimerase family protein [Pedobacter steynii]
MKTKLIKTGKIIDGKEILAIELTNTKGTYVKIYNYGAIISKFIVTNKNGEKQDIVLGFEDFDQYTSERISSKLSISRSRNWQIRQSYKKWKIYN